MIGSWRRVLHPLGPIGAQAFSHCFNLVSQLAIIALIGADQFGSVGLGLMTATSLCFIGDLGYGSFFLRHAAADPNWMDLWTRATGHRLIILVAAFPIGWTVLAGSAPDPDLGTSVLISGALGIASSAFNPAPLLFAQSRDRAAGLGIVARFLIQGLVSTIAIWLAPALAGLWVGAAFTLGILCQTGLGLACGVPVRTLRPQFTRVLPPGPALRLWSLSLVGTVNDRTLPYLVGVARPDILAAGLIVIQILQALAGLVTMLDRLLIPAMAKGGASSEAIGKAVVPLSAIIACVMAGFLALTYYFNVASIWMALLFSIEWGAVITGTLAFAMAFGQGRERPVAILMMWAVPLSTAAQVIMILNLPLEAPLALRAVVAIMAATLALRCIKSGPKHA